MNANRTRRGFTLIEILLVIAILGMLAAVLAVVIFPKLSGAKYDITVLKVQTKIPGALNEYSLGVGHFPTEEEGGLKALLTQPTFQDETLAAKWRGPYLKEGDLKDGWERDINYEVVDPGSTEAVTDGYKVWSNGKDGQSGNEDDIRSWKEQSGV